MTDGYSALPTHWQILETGDGSPSLRYVSESEDEAMHHSGGAFSETSYIYAPLLNAAFSTNTKPRILSLGLGLGYNEIFAARISLAANKDFILQSFEIDPWLRAEFKAWIYGENSTLGPLYEKICDRFQVHNLSPQIRNKLKLYLESGGLKLEAALTEVAQVREGTQAFLWDAFSRKTSPQLWDEEFLKGILAKAATSAGLSTYASQGNLKRALKASGFHFEERQGFQGKRSSTWATKGDFPSMTQIQI